MRKIRRFRRTRSVEQLYQLSVKLMQVAEHSNKRSFMLASCNHGEGTSTVLANLARVMAGRSKGKVLLIDGNLHNPVLANVFKVAQSPGLAEMIQGDLALDDVVQETTVANLHIVGAQKWPENPGDLLDSEKLARCLQQLKDRYAFVMLDCAPVIPYSDALYLSTKVDVVLLVMEAEKTRLQTAEQALKKLSDVGAEVLGTILNKRRYHIPSSVYNRL